MKLFVMPPLAAFGFFAFLGSPAIAQNTTCHDYDETGRLVLSEYSDGSELAYTLDRNDNRRQVHQDIAAAPDCPPPALNSSVISLPGGSFDSIPSNSPPVWQSPASASVTEGDTTEFYFAAATDAEGDTVSISVTGGADRNLFTFTPSTGSLRFNTPLTHTPAQDANADGVYRIRLTATDGVEASELVLSVTLLETSPSSTLDAVDDTYSFASANGVSLNVLENDVSSEHHLLTITQLTSPVGATASISADARTLSFSASSGGIFSFAYTVQSPSGATDTANVIVAVSGGNN